MRQKLSMLSFPLLLIYCYLVNSAEIAFNVGAGAPPLVKTRRSGHWELLSLNSVFSNSLNMLSKRALLSCVSSSHVLPLVSQRLHPVSLWWHTHFLRCQSSCLPCNFNSDGFKEMYSFVDYPFSSCC